MHIVQKLVLFLFILSFNTYGVTPQKTDVLIIGAGLSGLTTAFELQKLGISYHIIELSANIGGRVRTVKYGMPNGEVLVADSGMEEYWESNPAVKMIKEFKLKLRHDVAVSSIVLQGKKYEFTEDSQKEYMAKLFDVKELEELKKFKEQAGELFAKIEHKPFPKDLMKLKDVPFSVWAGERVKSKKVLDWIRVSIECEAGTQWDSFSTLDGIEEFSIFLGDGQESYRVINGNEIFTNTLKKKIGEKNITTNHRVTKVEFKNGKSTVSYLNTQNNTQHQIEATYVVSTVPPFRFAMEVQLDPGLSAKKMEAIQSQTYGSYFKAHLFVPASASRFWTKNGVSFLPFLSDSDLGVIYEGNPDQKTKTKIISLLITGDRAEGFNFMNQDGVREQIKKQFDIFWPGFSKEISTMEFYRYHPRAIGGWPVGRSRYDELSDELRKPENNLFIAGDFTEGTHSSDAIKSAYRVVNQIVEIRKKK